MYINATDIRRQFSISKSTLRGWADTNVVRSVRFGGTGKRLYHVADIRKHLGCSDNKPQEKEAFIYARVSSAHQKEDLRRQIEDLREAYPNHSIASDIASGINFKRKGLNTILDKAISGLVSEVVVMHKDRLCRFGAELIQFVFDKVGTRLVVHRKGIQEQTTSGTQELAEDLLAITTVFVAKHNGRRAAENRRVRKARIEGAQNQTLSEPCGRRTASGMDAGSEMDL